MNVLGARAAQVAQNSNLISYGKIGGNTDIAKMGILPGNVDKATGKQSYYLHIELVNGSTLSASFSRALQQKIESGEVKQVADLLHYNLFDRQRYSRDANGVVTPVAGQYTLTVGLDRSEVAGLVDFKTLQKESAKSTATTTVVRSAVDFADMRKALVG